jgi:catechol 2,3-dioxygenase-like lactoylglutathione lyase family enzyme
VIGDIDAVATIAVKAIDTARKFYGDVLRLEPGESRESQVLTYKSGSSKILVYESQFAGTNQATAVTWPVDDVAAEVTALKARGVTFEHYDFPGMKRSGDVHDTGRGKAAWFKDPDGNVLALVSR